MGKKTSLSIISFIIVLIYLPLGMYQQWLILDKIQGTDVMYFIYWISIPLALILNILSEIIKGMKEES